MSDFENQKQKHKCEQSSREEKKKKKKAELEAKFKKDMDMLEKNFASENRRLEDNISSICAQQKILEEKGYRYHEKDHEEQIKNKKSFRQF